MKRMILRAAACASMVCASSFAYANVFDRATFKLDMGMNDYTVAQVLGAPDRQQVKTCGSEVGINGDHAWACKTWTYEGNRDNWSNRNQDFLTIYFEQTPRGWVVNGWSVR